MALDLKTKSKEDSECKVLGYTNGQGKFQGQVGALICESFAGQFPHLTDPSEPVIKIGSELSDEDQRLLPEKDRIVNFQCMELTENKQAC